MKKKIFCIGFHKTGTTTLTNILEEFDIRSVHWPLDEMGKVSEEMTRKKVVEILEPLISRYQGFSDVPFPGLYKELDEAYPGSKFILTTRNSTRWWKSITAHFKLSDGKVRQLDPYERLQYSLYEPELDILRYEDKKICIACFKSHAKSVQHYFRNRPEDLFVWKLSTTGRIPWKGIANFLEMPVPETKRNIRANQKASGKTKRRFKRLAKRMGLPFGASRVD